MIRPPPVRDTDAGLYVHFPYCTRRCPYCDFNSRAAAFDDARYGDAVIAELRARGPSFERAGGFATIYFGGGTPSLWAPRQVGRVIESVREIVGLTPGAEVTLEANPESLSPARLDAFVHAGINRLSLGVQSPADGELAQLGRAHQAADARAAAAHAQAIGVMLSCDLIYGLPGQTAEALDASLGAFVSLRADHVSAYALTIKEGTPLARRVEHGELVVMSDDEQAAASDRVATALAGAGYERYEVSSYARSDGEAAHNSLYWIGAPYLGIGAGAHSYAPAPDLAGAERRENVRDPNRYIAGALAGRIDAQMSETLDRREAVAERLIVGVRARWGVDLHALGVKSGWGDRLQAVLRPAVDGLRDDGLVTHAGAVLAPTPRGLDFADGIARRLLTALDALVPAAATSLR